MIEKLQTHKWQAIDYPPSEYEIITKINELVEAVNEIESFLDLKVREKK